MRRWVLAGLLGCVLASLAQAAPLDPKVVSNEAKWVVHVDVDAVRASELIAKVHSEFPDRFSGLHKQFDQLHEKVGVDLREDLHGITIYGKKLGQREGTMVVYVDTDLKVLQEKAQTAPGHIAGSHGPVALHSWLENPGKKFERRVTVAFYQPSLLVFAATAEEVKAAVDVLDGKAPSVAGSQSLLVGDSPPGAIAAVRAADMTNAPVPGNSPLAKQFETLNAVVGEHQGEVFLNGKLTTSSTETAEQVKTTMEGGLAIFQLQYIGEPNMVSILQKLDIRTADRDLIVAFRAPIDEMWTFLQAGSEEMIRQEKARAEQRARKQAEAAQKKNTPKP